MAVVDHKLARSQFDLVAEAGKVPLVFLKNALKGGFQLEGCKGARPLELHGGIAAGVHILGSLVEFVGFWVVVVARGRWAQSRAFSGGFHDGIRSWLLLGGGHEMLDILYGAGSLRIESHKLC
jgi:hypothetical protein